MRNIKLLIQYEGTRYQGWQRQKSSENTIQGRLETLLGKMCGEQIELQGSGRTDAGVHAKAQVANFHTTCGMPVEEMLVYINRYLPEDIAVTEAEEVSPRFHSRLNAVEKCYSYRVLNSSIPDVFLRRYALQVPQPLDVEAMKRGAAHLLGEHDFKSFTSAKKGKKPTVRRIDSITIERSKDLLTFTFKGNGFLHHMIRILMGTLLEIGMGKRDPDSIPQLIASCSREDAGGLVPAKGLTLEEVKYEKNK